MLRLQQAEPEPGRLTWTTAIWDQFLAETAGRSARGVAVVTVLISLLYMAWAPGDFEYFPEHAVRFTWYRVATVIAVSLLAIWAVKAQRSRTKLIAMWLWFIPWGAQAAAMIPPTPDDLLSHTFVIVIAQLGSLGFVLWSWRWCLAMSLALVAICEVALLQVSDRGSDTFAAHGYLLTGAAFATIFTAVKFRGARQQFEQRLRLQEEKQRSERYFAELESVRRERLTWLENLARFLRHELRNQVVGVSTSLELTHMMTPNPETDRYVARAQRSLGRMRRLVDSATEATSLEAALATEEKGPVALTEVVEERLSAFEDVHPGRRFHRSVEGGVVVLGSEDRLAQLTDKLLENAVDHGAPAGEVWLSLRRHEGQVSLQVENDGEPLPADKRGLFDAFVTRGAESDRLSNFGLGLFVAKAITDAHEGTIEARDRPGGEGACFEVRLPLR